MDQYWNTIDTVEQHTEARRHDFYYFLSIHRRYTNRLASLFDTNLGDRTNSRNLFKLDFRSNGRNSLDSRG